MVKSSTECCKLSIDFHVAYPEPGVVAVVGVVLELAVVLELPGLVAGAEKMKYIVIFDQKL